jgi:death-on-curing family protein
MEKITKEQIIRTNAVFGGKLRISNQLGYAVERANKEKNFYRKLAYLVRAMTSDHSFIDGNKRTSLVLVLTEFAENGIKVDENRLRKTIVYLAKTGEGNINIIERRLRKCSKK